LEDRGEYRQAAGVDSVSSVFDLNQIIMPPKLISSFATVNRDRALG
jgi:hypothetical protein